MPLCPYALMPVCPYARMPDFLNRFFIIFVPALSCGVTGNTSDFGSEESKFEPWQDNVKIRRLETTSFFCCQMFGFFVSQVEVY
jgi:hypothetical protein